jgi:hypothetical protein
LIDLSCKAVILALMPKAVQFDSYGGVDVLEVHDVPGPVPEAASNAGACVGQFRGRTRAGMGAAATVVNGTARGKSSSRERISASRIVVASPRVASSMAK